MKLTNGGGGQAEGGAAETGTSQLWVAATEAQYPAATQGGEEVSRGKAGAETGNRKGFIWCAPDVTLIGMERTHCRSCTACFTKYHAMPQGEVLSPTLRLNSHQEPKLFISASMTSDMILLRGL